MVLELRRIAFADIRDYVEWDESNVWPISSDQISPEAARAIAGMTRSANGVVQIKLHDKVRALDMLAKWGIIDPGAVRSPNFQTLLDRLHPGRRQMEQRLATLEQIVEPR